MTAATLYGRELELKQVADLSQNSAARHIQIIGAKGVGKTAFVQAAVRALIAHEGIEQIVWLDAPQSVDAIDQHLANFLDGQGAKASLREFPQCQRTVFVFDGVGQLCDERERLQRLLRDLSSAVVYLTADSPLSVSSAMNYLVLSELEPPEAKRLIRTLLNQWHIPCYETVTSEDVEYVWEQSGGHPDAMGRAVLELQMQRTREGMTFHW